MRFITNRIQKSWHAYRLPPVCDIIAPTSQIGINCLAVSLNRLNLFDHSLHVWSTHQHLPAHNISDIPLRLFKPHNCLHREILVLLHLFVIGAFKSSGFCLWSRSSSEPFLPSRVRAVICNFYIYHRNLWDAPITLALPYAFQQWFVRLYQLTHGFQSATSDTPVDQTARGRTYLHRPSVNSNSIAIRCGLCTPVVHRTHAVSLYPSLFQASSNTFILLQY